MAKKRTDEEREPSKPTLPPGDALRRLDERIREGEALLALPLLEEGAVHAWQLKTEETLAAGFGRGSGPWVKATDAGKLSTFAFSGFSADDYSGFRKNSVKNELQVLSACRELLTDPMPAPAEGRRELPRSLIFISFSHSNKALAESLTKAVEAAGMNPFLSSDGRFGLTGGAGWFEELIGKIRSSAGLIFLATPASAREDWPTFEVGGVYCAGYRALSLCIGTAPSDLPKPLQNIQAVQIDESEEKVMHKIADALGKPLAALAPESKGAFADFLRLARSESGALKQGVPAIDAGYLAWRRKILVEILSKGSTEAGWKTIEHAIDHNDRWALMADKALLFWSSKSGNKFEISATDSLLARSDRLKTTDADVLLRSIDEVPLVEDEPLE